MGLDAKNGREMLVARAILQILLFTWGGSFSARTYRLPVKIRFSHCNMPPRVNTLDLYPFRAAMAAILFNIKPHSQSYIIKVKPT